MWLLPGGTRGVKSTWPPKNLEFDILSSCPTAYNQKRVSFYTVGWVLLTFQVYGSLIRGSVNNLASPKKVRNAADLDRWIIWASTEFNWRNSAKWIRFLLRLDPTEQVIQFGSRLLWSESILVKVWRCVLSCKNDWRGWKGFQSRQISCQAAWLLWVGGLFEPHQVRGQSSFLGLEHSAGDFC